MMKSAPLFEHPLATTKSAQLFERALAVIPGGVSSPVRSFKGLGMTPLVVERGVGDTIYDLDGRSFIDYCGSWGALILGHAPDRVVKAAQGQVAKGSSFGITTALEEALARKILSHMPSLDKIRFVSTGTEATMTALRLARAKSGKKGIVKFVGHYHGHSDSLLVSAGSGVAALPQAASEGLAGGVLENISLLPFNDVQALEAFFLSPAAETIACVILEPIAANMGVVLPRRGFLQRLRELTAQRGIFLIFDEVITGFRVGMGGAQGLFDIDPDLTCLGKIIGGGFPVAAVAGKQEIMDQLAPLGNVYQAGTLSGHPVGMAAGLATLAALEENDFHDHLERKAALLLDPIEEMIHKNALPVALQRIGSLFTLFFGVTKVDDFSDACRCQGPAFATFFKTLFNKGIYLSPAQLEPSFISAAHTEKHLVYTREVILEYLDGMQ